MIGEVLATAAVAVYVLLLLAMLAYGANSFLMVALHLRHRRHARVAPPPPDTRPIVTVQLPVFNEENVVVRVLEAAARLDWPKDRLQIQLLDDSTDATPDIAAPVVARLQAEGVDVVHIRRADRAGYKAGALANGLGRTDGELIAIFDADFVPPPDFLVRSVGYFSDPQVGVVQGRWTHLNRDDSALTRAQALGIDGHFGVEQAARDWTGWLLNFNGSGGVWRRATIEAAGGWSGDTLTEDLDLSYRAQLAGWRIIYDANLECPCELPMHMAAFKSQQRRWATGSMQVARKLLPSIWRSKVSLPAKMQASLHLTHYAVHPLIALTALLSIPCVVLPGLAASPENLWSLLLPFALAMSGPTLLHAYAQRVLEGRGLKWADLGMLTLIGTGVAVSNGRAVLAAFRPNDGEFVRTPKLGTQRRSQTPRTRYLAGSDGLQPIETGLALYCAAAGVALIWAGIYVMAPFMLLDAAGFAAVAMIARLEGAR